jgi:hypothetical protein
MYTLTATFLDVDGNSVDGIIQFQIKDINDPILGNSNRAFRVSGTGVIVPNTISSPAGSSASVTVFDNASILPAGSAYDIAVTDVESGNQIYMGRFVLTGSGGDLSSLTPV